jgi:hypothetical protein
LHPHPTIISSNRKPDFLAVKNGQETYIEATTISYFSEAEIKKENFKEKFVDELDLMNTPNFWLGLKTLEFKTATFPKVAKLRRSFEQKRAELDVAEIKLAEANTLKCHNLKYEDDQLLIEVSLHIKTEAAKNDKGHRAIGFRSSAVTIQDADVDSDKIMRNLKDKASRYGNLQKPYIVCLNLAFNFNIVHDVDWAFYSENGFNSHTPKFSKVSAALVTNVNVGSIFNQPIHRLIVNKHSSFPINTDCFNLSYEIDKKLMQKMSIDTLLKLENHNTVRIKL